MRTDSVHGFSKIIRIQKDNKKGIERFPFFCALKRRDSECSNGRVLRFLTAVDQIVVILVLRCCRYAVLPWSCILIRISAFCICSVARHPDFTSESAVGCVAGGFSPPLTLPKGENWAGGADCRIQDSGMFRYCCSVKRWQRHRMVIA